MFMFCSLVPIPRWDHEQCLYVPSNLWYRSRLSTQRICWSLRCSYSIACRRCSNYIFILDLTPGFNGSDKDNCETRRDSFEFLWFGASYITDFTVYVLYIYTCNSFLPFAESFLMWYELMHKKHSYILVHENRFMLRLRSFLASVIAWR